MYELLPLEPQGIQRLGLYGCCVENRYCKRLEWLYISVCISKCKYMVMQYYEYTIYYIYLIIILFVIYLHIS